MGPVQGTRLSILPGGSVLSSPAFLPSFSEPFQVWLQRRGWPPAPGLDAPGGRSVSVAV